MEQDVAEHNERLIRIAVGPMIWAAHFLLSYVTAAVWCARVAGRSGTLGGARVAIAIYTALALGGIAITGWRGWRRHHYGSATLPHDFDTPQDRHRALGFATVLLCGLSAVATLYVALAAVFIATCQ